MNEYNHYRTPGQLIKKLLNDLGWTQRVLAIILNVNETAINHIVAGRRPLTAELALSLEEVFSVPAVEFLELQKKYDLAQARIIARPDPDRNKRAHLFGDLPIADMIKRGWLFQVDNIKDVAGVEESLTKFFKASSVDEIEILPHAAKKTEVAGDVTPAQLAWLYRVKQISSEMLAPRYSQKAARSSIRKLKDLLISAEAIRKVPKILFECGIRFVIVEPLKGSKIDGVCFWLDDAKPVIGMSLRFDRIDNFWFVLRHELEHVLCKHGKSAIIVDVELEKERAGIGDDIPEEERQANKAASEFCIPSKKMDSFIARKAPFFAERDILGFARTMKIHPGIVAGQLQYRTGRYNRFRNHQVKIRSIVAPGAVVDGWGDVYPLEEQGD